MASVLNQSRGDFILRICDNASGDGTAEAVARVAAADSRVQLHIHGCNVGAQANFGWAFASVDTPFFALLSDDDVLLPGHLEATLGQLERTPAAMAWSGRVIVAEGARAVASLPGPGWPDGFLTAASAARLVARDRRPQNTGMIFRRRVIDADFHPIYLDFHASDVLWTLHAAAKGGIGTHGAAVAIFNRHEESLSSRAGKDVSRAIDLFEGSSARLLQHLPAGILTPSEQAEMRACVRATYGVDQMVRLGSLAAARGLSNDVARCIRVLADDLDAVDEARRLRRLSAVPSHLLRLWFALVHRLRQPQVAQVGLPHKGDDELVASYATAT